MSQKSSKRNRQRASVDEIDKPFKTPASSTKNKEDNGKQDSSDDEFILKGFSNGNNSNDPVRQYQTRSRSSTPQTKTSENAGKKSESDDSEITSNAENVDENEPAVPKENLADVEVDRYIFSEEMEPLVMERDEEISELNFDENDLDVTESFEKSPNRCTTRRSKNGDVATPKSQDLEVEVEDEIKSDISFDRLPEIEAIDLDTQPEEVVIELDDTQSSVSTDISTKAVVGEEISIAELPTKEEEIGKSVMKKPEVQAPENVDFNDTSDTHSTISTDNISTKAVAGSDVTRNADITYQDVTFEENTYTSPNRSIIESYGSLSSRRTIRPISTDYRRFALRNNCETKGEYEAVERITPGIKRKDRSLSPLGNKRFKRDGSGFFSYLTSPISNLKGTFGKSSTPTLIAFEKRDGEFDNSEGQIKIEQSDELNPKKWCSIM